MITCAKCGSRVGVIGVCRTCARNTKPLNWRTARTKEHWYTGPDEGRTYIYARKGGQTYTVSANWHNWQTRDRVTWWAQNGKGNNTAWKTQDAAKRACERMARGVTDAR